MASGTQIEPRPALPATSGRPTTPRRASRAPTCTRGRSPTCAWASTRPRASGCRPGSRSRGRPSARSRSRAASAPTARTARGPIVDTAALAEALRERRLFGAGLDVTDPEPLPQGHPLLALENALIAPHTGSAGVQTRARMAELAAHNLIDALAGRRPRHLVNPEAWREP